MSKDKKLIRSLSTFRFFSAVSDGEVRLVVSVHVSVGLGVSWRVGQLGRGAVDAGGHQLVLEVGETEAGNFSGERQFGGGRKVVEGERAGHVDAGSRRGVAAAADGRVGGRGSDPDAARHDGQNFGDLSLQVKNLLVLLRRRGWKNKFRIDTSLTSFRSSRRNKRIRD